VVSPEAVLLIIKGWKENGSTVLVSASSINLSVWGKCRVADVEGNKAVFRSNDTDVVITFVVESGFSFKYKELREVAGLPGFESVPRDKMLNSALTATLASSLGHGDLVQVILIEI
jgi:hypothetical protein